MIRCLYIGNGKGSAKMDGQFLQIEKRFRTEIEGLRFIAALLVAIYHIWLGRVSGGVDVFFIISGYLITASIISKINKQGYLSFSKYFGGLLKRLLPNVLVILTVVAIATFWIIPSSIHGKTIKELIASLFYYQNLQLGFSHTDYLNSEQAKTPLEHFWAMSIQGQFYVIWFILFSFIVLLWKKLKTIHIHTTINIILIILFLGSLTFSIFQTSTNQQFAYFNPVARVWQFALGGLVYLNLFKIKIPVMFSNILGWIGLVGLILTGIIFDVSTMFPGYVALWPMTCAILILLSGNDPSHFGVEALLSRPILMKLGGISFGIYLWHWVLLSFYKYTIDTHISTLIGIGIILLSIALSAITTNLVEKPIRGSFGKPVRMRLGVFFAVVLCLMGTLGLNYKLNDSTHLKDLPPNHAFPGATAKADYQNKKNILPRIKYITNDKSDAYDDGGMIYQGAKVKPLTYGQKDAYQYHILLVGGSHSSHWLGALQQIAEKEKIKITHLCKANARFTMGEQDALSQKWMENTKDYIKKHKDDYDLVFTTADVGNDEETDVPQGFIDAFRYLESLDLPVFAVRDTPRLDVNAIEAYEKNKNVTIDVSKQLPDKNFQPMEDTGAKVYDYNNYIAPNHTFKPVRGNIFVFFDSSHMTNTFSRTLGPVIKDDLMRELKSA